MFKLCGKISRIEIIANVLIIFVFLYLLALAIFTPPYNSDSMAYHLPRVLQWIQNASVEHYATNYINQIAHSPLHEFIVTHLYMLSGETDYLVNLVQTFSFFSCTYVIFMLTRLLGGDKKAAYIAVFLWIGCPTAIGESLTTQTDLFAGMWLIFCVYLIVRMIKKDKIDICKENCFCMSIIGMLVGLAYCTKQHALFGIAFFAILWLIHFLKKRLGIKSFLLYAVISGGSAILIVLPELVRMMMTFGTPFPVDGGASIMLVKTLSPRYLFMNLVKAIAYNMYSYLIPGTELLAKDLVIKVSKLLGIDMNAEVITWHNFELPPLGLYDHDIVPYSTIEYLLIVSVIVGIVITVYKIIKLKQFPSSLWFGFGVCTLVSYTLILIISRHTNANVRYQVTYLVLLCPLISLIIQEVIRNTNIRNCIMGGILAITMVTMINTIDYHTNVFRFSNGDREKGLFRFTAIENCNRQIVEEIECRNVKTIGTYIPGLFEYPVRRLLLNDGEYLFYSINVQNESKKYEDTVFLPDILLWITFEDQNETINYNGEIYNRVFYTEDSYEKYSLYMR